MSAIITVLIIGMIVGIIGTISFLWWAVKQNDKKK